MHPRSLPLPSWLLALLIGFAAASLTGCESDRHHRDDDRDAPRGRFEQHAEHARAPGPQQGGQPGNMDHGSGPQWGPQGQGHDQRGPSGGGPGNQGQQPESLLHRLEMGREAAREIGDREAADAMQRAVERARQDHGEREHEPRDGDRQRLERLERRIEELMRAVEELRRDRGDRKAI